MPRHCSRCNQVIPEERVLALNTYFCIHCAGIRGTPKVKGAMIYSHKTAPELQVMSIEYYETQWKFYNPKFGRGSGVHKVSKPTSSI